MNKTPLTIEGAEKLRVEKVRILEKPARADKLLPAGDGVVVRHRSSDRLR